MSKITIDLEIKGNAKDWFNRVVEDFYYTAKNGDDETLERYESLKYSITKGKKINAKRMAKLLTNALNDGDVNTIWYVIGELEKGAN